MAVNTKQLLILNRDLTIKKVLIVNKVIPVEDIISPQKTTFEIVKNKDVKIGDLIVLKNDNNVNEYIGVIQDIQTENTTILSAYPLINVTDMDFQLTSIANEVVADWIQETLYNNLVNTDDKLLKLPLLFSDYTDEDTLELSLEDGNLFDALITIFKKTGIYLNFELHYSSSGELDGIMCNIRKAGDDAITLRYDNPLLVERPTVELSQAQDTNKLIFKPADNEQTHQDVYVFYLLDNNTVSQDENSANRINGVVQSIMTYSDDNFDEGLDKIAEENLLGDNLNHQITIKILNNSGFNFNLYTKVIFIDENRTYETYVTRVENYNNVYKTIKLGVLRNTLTDKVKDLQKSISNFKTSTYTSSSSVSGDYASKDYVQTETSLLLTNASVDNETGIFTFQRKNGTTFTIDTLLEKVVTNFTYNETTQSLELTLEDGTVKSIPMTAFIDDYTGSDGTYINVTVSNDNKISATIKNGSITEDLLSIQLQDKIDSIVDYSDDINKILNNTSIIANSNGGFKSGVAHSGSVVDVTSGGAVGNLAKTTSGGSIGNNAETTSGGAVGNEANSGLGGAIGDNAVTTSGGSVGNGAISGLGFSGGRNAKVRLTDANDNTTGIDAIQLGAGTNQTAKTLQVYDDNIYNANTHTMSVQNLEVNGQNIDDKIDGFVSYGQTQNLTDAEKQRARNNIGAGTSNFSGSYNDLTDKPASSNVQDIIDNVTVISQPKPDNTTSGSEVTQYSGFGGFVAGNGAELKETENSISFGGQTMTTVMRGSGGAIGKNAKANDGGAVGSGAEATDGFSGGENAKSTTDAIQLGAGTNNSSHTLQVYGDNIYNANTHTLSVQNLEVKNSSYVTTNTEQNIESEKTFENTITFTKGSGRYLDANNGAVPIILDRTGGKFNMLANMKSTNGVFCFGTYQNRFMITYTSNETIEAGTNAVDKQWWFNEDGTVTTTNGILIPYNDFYQTKKSDGTILDLIGLYSNSIIQIGDDTSGFGLAISKSEIKPFTSNKNLNLGSSSIPFKNGYFSGTITVPTPATNDNSTKVATTQWVNTAIDNAISSSGGITTLTTNTNMWELDAGLYLVNQNVRLYYNLSEYITLSSNGILQILKNSITILFNVTFSFNHIYYSYSGTANSSTGELLSPIQYYSSYGIIGITPNTNENEKMFTTIEWVNNKLTPTPITASGVEVTGQNDTVVDYWVASDGNTWYREWASGWIEQGGWFGYNQGSSTVNRVYEIFFPKPFANKNYYYTAQIDYGYLLNQTPSIQGAHTIVPINKVESYCTSAILYSNSGYEGGVNRPFYWYACGIKGE